MPELTKIIIAAESHRNAVHGAHNGVRYDLPVGKEIEVNEGVLGVLADSGVSFNRVEGEGEGSPASSTTEVLPGTAYDEGVPNIGAGGEPRTLSQTTDPDATDAGKTQAVNVVEGEGNVGATASERGLLGGGGDAPQVPLTSPRDDADAGVVPPSPEEAKKAAPKRAKK